MEDRLRLLGKGDSRRERIIGLLANRVAPSIIADIVVCSPSYVSQISAEPEVAEYLLSSRTKQTEKDVMYDDLLDKAAERALHRINSALPTANLAQAVRALGTLDKIGRRTRDSNHSAPVVTTQVTIVVPARVQTTLVLNRDNEIIEAGGRPLASATPEILAKMTNTPLRDHVEEMRSARKMHASEMLNTLVSSAESKTPPVRKIALDDLGDII